MVCENCDPKLDYPGRLIKTTKDLRRCIHCRELLHRPNTKVESTKWDKYFHSVCIAVSSKSPCLSRKIGAILVRDHSIVATGYNGPARGIPHCGHERYMKDDTILEDLSPIEGTFGEHGRFKTECPRKVLGHKSGTHMELCPAQHAEANCISNAARLGVSTVGTTLYMNCVIPCKNCYGALINAGIVEIVVDDAKPYDKHTQFQIDNSNIKIREFEK